MWPNRVWPKNLSPLDYFSLSLLVIFCLWVLVFRLDAEGARGGGLFFLVVGVFLCLTHRPSGWFMFKTRRTLHLYSPWEGLEAAQASYLAFGLVLMGVGCVYLIRFVF